MAKNLSKSGITTTSTIEAWHVTQSVDAFTGTDAYDITISGSLSVIGTTSGSFVGDGSGLTGIAHTSASYALSSSYAISASYAPSSGGTPGGSTTQVQFNDGGNFGGDSGFTFDKTTNSITAITDITSSGNISSSGTIFAKSGSFSHLVGNSPITISSPVIFKQPITASFVISSSNVVFISASALPTASYVMTYNTASGEVTYTTFPVQSSTGGNTSVGNPTGTTVLAGNNVNVLSSGATNFQNPGGSITGATINNLTGNSQFGTNSIVLSGSSGTISASGDLTIRHITASGNISASGTISGEHIFSSDDIVAQGDISASGTIQADKLEAASLISHLGDANTGLQFGSDTVSIESNDIIVATFATTQGQRIGNASYATGITGSTIGVTGPTTFKNSVTASSDISASGYIVGKMHDRQVGYTGSMFNTLVDVYVTCSVLLTTGNLGSNGDYMVYFNCDWANTMNDKQNEFRLKKNGTVLPYGRFQENSVKDNELQTTSFQYLAPNVVSGTTFEVDFANVEGNDNSTVYTSSLIIDGVPTLSNIS